MEERISRRKILAAFTGGSVISISGCVEINTSSENDEESNDDIDCLNYNPQQRPWRCEKGWVICEDMPQCSDIHRTRCSRC